MRLCLNNMDILIAPIIILLNFYVLLKNAALKYNLRILGKALSFSVKIAVIIWLFVYVDFTCEYNRIDLCHGYSFSYVNDNHFIAYSNEHVKGFISEDKYGSIYLNDRGVTQDHISVYAMEYADDYIIARGVDPDERTMYWIIFPKTSDSMGPLAPDEFEVECARNGIKPLCLISIKNHQPFAF